MILSTNPAVVRYIAPLVIAIGVMVVYGWAQLLIPGLRYMDLAAFALAAVAYWLTARRLRPKGDKAASQE